MTLTTLAMTTLLALSPARAAVKGQAIDYKDGDTALEGYLAYDDSVQGKRPGVLVVHDWLGNGPYVRRRAEQLAKLGYVAFAIDMYGKGVYAKDHDEAGKLAGAVKADREMLRRRALAGLAVLQKEPHADTAKLAAMGYCFGGTTALELARAGAPLLGVISFHGALDTPHPEADKPIQAKVLVFQGGDDKFTLDKLPAFQDEMRSAKADWQVVTFGGAVHSFTVKEAGDDPSTGMAYNANADRRSWQGMQEFFKEIFGK